MDKSININMIESHMPLYGNIDGNGNGAPMLWEIQTNTIQADIRYMSIIPDLSSSTSRFDTMTVGTEVLLFDFMANYNIPSETGISIIDINDTDNPSFATNGFTTGGSNQLYNGNLTQTMPTNFANNTGQDSIGIGETSALTPTANGVWVSGDATIASINNSGLVTGEGHGYATLTFTSNLTGCSSSVIIEVGLTLDTDGDGIFDVNDNCPTEPNADQADTNQNGIGDECDDPIPPPDPTGDPSVAISIEGDGNQGILIPRLSEQERLAIQNPAMGLLLFQYNEVIGFYYFDGTLWKKL